MLNHEMITSTWCPIYNIIPKRTRPTGSLPSNLSHIVITITTVTHSPSQQTHVECPKALLRKSVHVCVCSWQLQHRDKPHAHTHTHTRAHMHARMHPLHTISHFQHTHTHTHTHTLLSFLHTHTHT